jgi:hypothetical protein
MLRRGQTEKRSVQKKGWDRGRKGMLRRGDIKTEQVIARGLWFFPCVIKDQGEGKYSVFHIVFKEFVCTHK